jgi:UDP-4-amino-4,6-dideoxy-N-acetyl-beta-L-altrosamine transaminase
MQAKPLPYGLHLIEPDDVAAVRTVLHDNFVRPGRLEPEEADAVLDILNGELLAQGPQVARFENTFAETVGAKHAVACSSGTAALHLALRALDVGPGDTCVVPAITFLSTATAALFCGADVVFADVDPVTGLMTADTLAEACGRAKGPVKAALPVHLGGRFCDMNAIAKMAESFDVELIEDACHALGSKHWRHGKAGQSRHSKASVFSFHPVKTIACGEGGMVSANDPAFADRINRLRNHGVTRQADLLVDPDLSMDADGQPNPWSYEQLELGFNYRMTEIEAALGLSQLGKLDRFVSRRRELAGIYDELLAPLSSHVTPVPYSGEEQPSLHLYAVHLNLKTLGQSRGDLMRALLKKGIGTQVHYIPVYRQPYFVQRYGHQRLAGAEAYYAGALSLPLFPAMTDEDAQRVVLELTLALR